LDIGGGGDVAGLHDVIAERFAGEMHAVDQGADVQMGRDKGLNVQRCDIDVEALPYPDGFFDVVLFMSVIEHLYFPRHAVDEIARVLKPGGLLFLETPNAVAMGRRLDALLGRNPFRWFNEYNAIGNKAPMVCCSVFYTAEEIERLLSGPFEILERRYAMHDPAAGLLKRIMREIAFCVRPSLGDCFSVVARRAVR